MILKLIFQRPLKEFSVKVDEQI